MEELGFVITPDGNEFKFGKYKPYFLRDKENPQDYHNTSFRTEVMTNKEWQSLGYPLDEKFDISYDIALLAKWGIVVGLNKTEGAYTPSTSTIMFASPINLTKEQLEILMAKKEQLLEFDKDISFIRVIDESGTTVDRPQFMKDYYENYIIPNLEKKQKETRKA